MAKKDKRVFYERVSLGTLLFILIILISLLVFNVHKLQGTARVVNYAGMVRGTTQRLIKLEIAKQPNELLVNYVDDILYGLQNSSVDYDLIRINDENFQNNVSKLNDLWKMVKEEIYLTREVGYQNTKLLQASEDLFSMANEMVTTAEIYSKEIVTSLIKIEISLVIVIILLVSFLIVQVVGTIKLLKNNKSLNEKAYIDLHTMLPNKSRCTEILSDVKTISSPTGVMMFDINYLRHVNDKLGHTAGDTLIQNFANILRTTIPSKDFVGRNGGDEFLGIIYETSEEEMKDIIDNIRIAVEKFNSFSHQMFMSYSIGYDISTNYKECNLSILVHKADENMILDKEEFHRKYKSLDFNFDN